MYLPHRITYLHLLSVIPIFYYFGFACYCGSISIRTLSFENLSVFYTATSEVQVVNFCFCLIISKLSVKHWDSTPMGWYTSIIDYSRRFLKLKILISAFKNSHQLTLSLRHRRATNQLTTIRWLVHWPLMGGLLHLVQGPGQWRIHRGQGGHAPPRSSGGDLS